MNLNRRKFLTALLAAPVAAKAAAAAAKYVIGIDMASGPDQSAYFFGQEGVYVSDGSIITLIEARIRKAAEDMHTQLMYESCMHGTGFPMAVTFPPKIQTKFNPARLPV